MTGGRVAALIFAIPLLLPGGCFLYLGIGLMGESHLRVAAHQMLIIGIVMLALIGFLFWAAFRKPPPPAGTGGSAT